MRGSNILPAVPGQQRSSFRNDLQSPIGLHKLKGVGFDRHNICHFYEFLSAFDWCQMRLDALRLDGIARQ